MAKLDFGTAPTKEKPTEAKAEVVESPTTEIVPREALTPAVAHYESEIEGELDSRDIVRPRLMIVQKSSSLVKTDPEDTEGFNVGDWLINKEVKVGNYKTPLAFVVLWGRKMYQEVVKYGAEDIPRMFRNATECREAGLVTEWSATVPRAAEIFQCLLWLPQPEGVDAPHIFTLESPEGPGVVVAYTASGTAYSSFGKPILTASVAGHLTPQKGGLTAGKWDLYATLEKRENNSWLQPRVRPAGRVSDSLKEFLATSLG